MSSDPKVCLGFFSFTEVTRPDAHRAYNEWHQLDHLPEQIPLAGIVSGERWVLTPACRAAAVAAHPLAAVHYTTLYLMAEPRRRTLEEFRARAVELHAAGRFFEERRARLSGPFEIVDRRAAARVLVSAEAVPHRPGRGVFVVVEAVSEPERAEPAAPTATPPSPSLDPDRLVQERGVAGVWVFESATDPETDRRRTGRHRITVCFLDDEPLAVAARLMPEVAHRRAADPEILLAAPMETVVPWVWDWFEGSAGPEGP